MYGLFKENYTDKNLSQWIFIVSLFKKNRSTPDDIDRDIDNIENL